MSKNYHTDNPSFIMYKDWEKFFDNLTDAQAGKAIKAAFAFVARAEMPDFKNTLHLVFLMMKDAFERDGAKWEAKCEKNAKSAQKGGLKKQANACERYRTLPNATERLRTIADKDKDMDMDKDKDKEKDTDKEREKEKEAVSPLPFESESEFEFSFFGEYGNVKLTAEQHKALIEDFGADKVAEYIKRCDEYVQQKGKPYNDYNLTIRKWLAEDDKKQNENGAQLDYSAAGFWEE